MQSKEWYQSKTIWAGLFMWLIAVFQMATTGNIDITAINEFLSGLGLIGIRHAID